MRILFITDKFIPERGGSQIIFGNTYAHLEGHEVTVLTRAWPGDTAVDTWFPHRVIRVPYSRVPKVRSPLLWLSLARHARQVAAQVQFDQIHCGQTVETAPAGTLLAKQLGIPSVVHTFAEDVTTYLKHPVYRRMMQQALHRASAVSSISRFTVDHLCRLGISSRKVSLLYPGVTPHDWTRPDETANVIERYGLQGRRVILTVSRLIPRKGQDVVLRALPAVIRKAPDLIYLIVGGGPEEHRLRSLASELGVQEHVRFVGSIANTDAGSFYHASDVFVMPNRQMPNGDIEGFGLVFLEANACGKPVIGGRSGGTPDAIEDGVSGYLVEPTSASEVAARLIELLEDPHRATRMGEAGRARVVNEFTWAHSERRLQRLIELAGSRFSASGDAPGAGSPLPSMPRSKW